MQGFYNSTITCPDCVIEIKSEEIFTQISLPIKPKGKKIFYNYVIIRKDKITKGKAEVF